MFCARITHKTDREQLGRDRFLNIHMRGAGNVLFTIVISFWSRGNAPAENYNTSQLYCIEVTKLLDASLNDIDDFCESKYNEIKEPCLACVWGGAFRGFF